MPDTWDYTTNRPERTDRVPGPAILTKSMVALSILFTVAFHTMDAAKGTWWAAIGRAGSMDSDSIWDGRVYGLFTSVFVHGSPGNLTGTLMHIGFNMMWLLTLGTMLEQTLGRMRWALFFICAAVAASGAELALSSRMGIGMSGVVYAMFGLMWAGRRQYPEWQKVATPQNLNLFITWGLICLAGTWAHFLSIANAAHGGGFLFGLAVGWLFIEKKSRVLAGACLAALIAMTVISVTWMPWSGAWCFWKASGEYYRHDYASAIDWFRRSIRLGEDRGAALNNIVMSEEQRGNPAGAEAARKELGPSTGQSDSPDAPPTDNSPSARDPFAGQSR